MRIMGIDFGDSRIGIALSDLLGWTAQGLETINWSGDMNVPVKRIKQLVNEYGIEKIVVGYPVNMNGTVGARGEKTMEFITMLTNKIGIDVIKWDERLTSVAASRIMHESGVKTGKKKKIIDQIAASLILQGYLDSTGNR